MGCGGRGGIVRAMGWQGGLHGPWAVTGRADERCQSVRWSRVVL